MKNFFAKKSTVAVVFFLIGAGTMWSLQTVLEYKRQAEKARRMINDPMALVFQNIFGTQEETGHEPEGWQLFDIEKRLHQFLMGRKTEKEPEQNNHWFSPFLDIAQSFDLGQMNEREDDLYRYYEFNLNGKKPIEVKITFEENIITMTGTFGSSSDHSKSTFTFHKSFPAPNDIDLKDYKIEQIEDKLVVKFKKIATI